MINTTMDGVSFHKDGATSSLFLTPDSGRIIYRDKIDTIIGIKHPGIILGNDIWGTTWVIHNHYKIGYPQVATLYDFADGVATFFDGRQVMYDPIDVVKRAIWHWQEKKEYSWLLHNCQHFVNKVTQNKNYSETIEKVSDNALFAGGLFSILGLLTNDKNVVQIGLGIAGAGAVGKIVNNA